MNTGRTFSLVLSDAPVLGRQVETMVSRTSSIGILLHFTLIVFNTLQFLVLLVWVFVKTVCGEACNMQTRLRFATT